MSDVQTSVAPAAPEAAVVANSTPEAAPSIENTMGDVYDKHYPSARVDRADNGKFESKTKPAEGAETAEPAEAITQEPIAEQPETVKAEAKPSIKPRPQSWSADLDQWWSELPPERQDFLTKRESETHQKITQLGERATAAEKFSAIIERNRSLIGNAQPEQEIENLFQTKAALLRDPPGSIKWLADQLGVDLSQFAQAPREGEPAENGQIRSLTQQVAQLTRQLGDTHNRLTAREQSESQAREQSSANLIKDFAKGKEDHWSEVEPHVFEQILAINAAIQQGVRPEIDGREKLEEAYKRVVKLNDDLSNRLTKAKRDKEAADKAATDKRKADEAKRLASLNTKSSSGATPKTAFKSFEDEMSNVYDKVAARG